MRFTYMMTAKKAWSSHDRLMFVTYLFMQERISEAEKEFKKITSSDLSGIYGEARLQYDYI